MWITDGLMTVNDVYMLGIIDQVKPHADVVFLGNGRSDGILAGIELNSKMLQATSLEEAATIFFELNGNFIPQALQAQVLSPSFYRRTQGIAFDALGQMLGQYDSDAGTVIQKVLDGRVAAGFILNPTRIEEICRVADAGLTMPRKSTYFYPKVITGLVQNRLAD